MDAKNVLRKGTTQVTRALRKLGNAIDKVGAVPEMGMRLAVYTALRDSGWSQAQAAQYAREITVDFNAKGEWTPFFNTLYMFSNAAIQSFARYMKAFAKTRDEKGTARALGNLSVPIALNILIGYLAASALWDDDDDENGGLGSDGRAGSTLENLNDYELENNLHIKIGNGVTLRLPTRGTMAPFVYLGQKLAKYQRGLETEEEFLTDVATSMVQANLNFMGQSPTIGQQLAPTVADPLVQWLEGKDWAGRDLFRRDYGQAGSDAHQGFERTPWIYRSAVQALNELTGGDEVQSGAIDWRPESLKLFTDFILGSISQNAGSIANLADKLGGDESVETGVNDVPFIGGLVREVPNHTSRYYREFDRFDTLRKEMAMYESLAKNARTAGERQAYFAKADAMVAEHPELRFAKGLKRLSDNITDIRKTIREEEARPAEERNQAFIDFLEQQNLELMAEFLRALRR